MDHGLNEKTETIKYLEENIRVNSCDPELGKVLDLTWKAQAAEEKNR